MHIGSTRVDPSVSLEITMTCMAEGSLATAFFSQSAGVPGGVDSVLRPSPWSMLYSPRPNEFLEEPNNLYL
jgi:hypothetical protein